MSKSALSQCGVTRRQMLRQLGAVGLATAGASILAACQQQAGSGAAPAGKSGGGEITIRFNHTDGRGGEAFFFAERFKELAEQRSNGRIKVQNFHSGELGAEKDLYDSLQFGSIEMGRTGSLIISAVVPQYGALEMPYAFRSQEHLRNVLSGSIGEEMHKEILTQKGIRVLAIVNRGPRQLTTKDREVRMPADLRGFKLRVPEIPAYVEAWRALGASPTPMAFPEVFTGLQQGTIDGQENPLGTIAGNSFYDVQKYLIQTAHVRGNGWMIASDMFWQRLGADEQQLLQQAASDAATHADERVAASEAELEQTLKSKGMTFIEPDLNAFREGVKDVPARFKDTWKAGLFEQIQQTQG
jgi:tripartite ATP-independent transporter DctP family solute receptor